MSKQKRERQRIVYFIPADAYVEGKGYRASVVFEGEAGHHPTGTWPYDGRPGQSHPYFWGHDYREACEIAYRVNEKRGISREDASKIVGQSIVLQIRSEQRTGKRS